MPVVTLQHRRLERLVGKSIDEILAMLPYIALDIEEEGNDYVKVEYNPNRPDFSTDYGIARALRGIMGIEVGLPRLNLVGSSVATFNVDASVDSIRPYVLALVAFDGRMDDEDLRQLISMQEDLHMGIGRKRRKVSIGLHDYDKVNGPFYYTTESKDFKFIPLNSAREMSMQEILASTDVGKAYGHIIKEHARYPIIKDAKDNVLSFPPIVNAELTRVTEHTKNMLVEVTATDLNTAKDVLAVIAVTLSDMGFKVASVSINYDGYTITTPEMSYRRMSLPMDRLSLLGLDIDRKEVIECLRRSRLDVEAGEVDGNIECLVPRYRVDIIHWIDLVEEVAIGYNISRFEPRYPRLKAMGSRHRMLKVLDDARSVMVGLGMLEVMNFNLVSMLIQYEMVGRRRDSNAALVVEESKSKEHEVLRDSLVPSLLAVLSRNVHEPYPQRLFEVGKVFSRDGDSIREEWSVAAVIAHSSANYTEARSYLQALLYTLFGIDVDTEPVDEPPYESGKAAEILFKDKRIGSIGEVSSSVLSNFRIRVPVSAFEVIISRLYSK
ncbi:MULTISPECIES: phenylalanine--tRNA ligase subunit beta [Candidatus Nitrosocaldus]|jgi:phenylalanyl-tRNA synthetase beta chain|uniref:phenylalanine--tRNA ligase n=1 Tax=Candidatus Nitrosocaldus cavascurensis TaxID=2058097 RepID=A0A2K5ASJ9_9ARCH|nr:MULTISPECIES: phenylalanine--tRNA ligase subunit beta [Candidatus Nitrosocaldus]SPC34628.1 Phenylalanine--tRNA ligase beta subunit [Candidatus Nitrosocaldus cavascurensis]